MMNLIIYERKQTNYQIVFVCWLMVTLMVAKEKYHRICQTGFFKIFPHIVGSFKDTMTQESLLKNQGKYVKFVFAFPLSSFKDGLTSHFMQLQDMDFPK